MKNRYYSYNQYLREKFGCRVHRLSLNAGFSCPNLDGTLSRAGCIFCNNLAFGRFAQADAASLEEQISRSMEYSRRRFKAEKFIAYFQSFSNTYGETADLRKAYDLIRKFDDIVGLAVSTRPDCIDREKLDLISGYGRDYDLFMEYGLQTVHDRTLAKINRNHSYADFLKAVEMTAARKNIHVAAHLILGLPGESIEDMLQTASCLAGLPLWGIKFHCLHVVKGTALEKMNKKEEVRLLSEDEYTDILIRFLERIPDDWVVLRLVSEADKNLLVAPLWVNDKQRVLRKIENELEKRDTWQGRKYKCKMKN